MSNLKAFVGHGFSTEDEEVVRPFLEFFDRIKDMGIGFSWESAKPAEPKELAEKVLALVKDKSLFIGICTQRERAIDPGRLARGIIQSRKLCADETDFVWKTSDWLIQEIGLAFGREMKIILLVEEGLRQSGGLQGNLEYIQFSRQRPEKSFNKFLEMIKSLIPMAVVSEGETISHPTLAEEEKEPEEKQGADLTHPDSTWSMGHYQIALLHVLFRGDEEGEGRISSAFQNSPFSQDNTNKIMFEATQEDYRIRHGKGGSLGKLESLKTELPENVNIIQFLARAYKFYGEENKAAQLFLEAAEKEGDSGIKLELVGEAYIA